MAKVYLITSGSYSDYSIDKIFLSKEKAEQYHDLIKRTHYDVNDIEIYDLSDDEIFTPYYYIQFVYYIPGMEEKYRRSILSDGRPSLFGGEYYIDLYMCNDDVNCADNRCTSYHNGILTLTRPVGYDKSVVNLESLEQKYLKVCQDLTAQIRYHLYMGANDWDIIHNGLFDQINSTYFETEAAVQN